MGLKRRNLHIVKMSCWCMKALTFWVFDHFANSPTNYRFFDTCLMLLKLQKMGRKLKQSLEVPILTCELLLCFYKQRSECVFVHVGKSFVQCLFSILVKDHSLSKKLYPQRLFIQMVKCFLLDKKIVYQVSMVRRSCLFTSRKSSVFWQASARLVR